MSIPFLQNTGMTVTLHVSVWVEIRGKKIRIFIQWVTLHVSVWVEIVGIPYKNLVDSSRSTWACELKWSCRFQTLAPPCHAPRERVSWNSRRAQQLFFVHCHAPRERVSWNDIHRTNSIERITSHAPRERVSWNFWRVDSVTEYAGHAPRERVSWNNFFSCHTF